jgi:hypothetical protein
MRTRIIDDGAVRTPDGRPVRTHMRPERDTSPHERRTSRRRRGTGLKVPAFEAVVLKLFYPKEES